MRELTLVEAKSVNGAASIPDGVAMLTQRVSTILAKSAGTGVVTRVVATAMAPEGLAVIGAATFGYKAGSAFMETPAGQAVAGWGGDAIGKTVEVVDKFGFFGRDSGGSGWACPTAADYVCVSSRKTYR
jgi:hypothetical protein